MINERRKQMNSAIFTDVERSTKKRQADIYAQYGKAFLKAAENIAKKREKR